MNKIYIDLKLINDDEFTIEKIYISKDNISKIVLYRYGTELSKETIYTLYSGNEAMFITDIKTTRLEISTQTTSCQNSFVISNGIGVNSCCAMIKSDLYISDHEDRILLTTIEQPHREYVQLYNEDDLVE